jgi:hypothetical protein
MRQNKTDKKDGENAVGCTKMKKTEFCNYPPGKYPLQCETGSSRLFNATPSLLCDAESGPVKTVFSYLTCGKINDKTSLFVTSNGVCTA